MTTGETNTETTKVRQASFLAHRSPHIESFDDLVRIRHSTRFFLPSEVPRETIISCLKLAQHAPSNSNIQPWHLFLASGSAKQRVCDALVTAATEGTPQIPPLPDHYKHFRSEFGRLLYGEQGYNIPREDKVAHGAATRRNFEFFGAPVCGVVCMDQALDSWDAMSVGMWLQTFVLALTERGLGTCLEVSVIGYPEVLRKEMEIPDDMLLMCGIAIGVPEKDHQVNKLDAGREAYEKHVVWREE